LNHVAALFQDQDNDGVKTKKALKPPRGISGPETFGKGVLYIDSPGPGPEIPVEYQKENRNHPARQAGGLGIRWWDSR